MNTKLYRPVGVKELDLIEQLDMKGFPPRLSWKPIFYPVLNFEYAAQIANDWNTKDEFSGYAGFVTEFEVPTPYFESFEVQNVGSAHHNELWVPAEKMSEFNDQIIGKINVVGAFYENQFQGKKRYQSTS